MLCAAGGDVDAVGADGAGETDGASIGAPLGIGVWRQIGIFALIVGVGRGVARGLGVDGSRVGCGAGGTRGSGKRGSPAAERVEERFQSGPKAALVGLGAGVTTSSPAPSE